MGSTAPERGREAVGLTMVRLVHATRNMYNLHSAGHVRPSVAEARNPPARKSLLYPMDDGVSRQREESSKVSESPLRCRSLYRRSPA
ncbi:hypothetical protein TIFTF001_007608 [Ficus carica]|uniref:Uncharacterized protein n=1 Tax=Ficus carica TaxID=3494 RepID=A0AA87ZQH7_FICCA|nr:hypothetical protein TIFTF001_007608 [Ficus carica]